VNPWHGRRVVIIGAARQGTALARHLVARGAQVTISDLRSQHDLNDGFSALKDLDVRWVLGEHPTTLLDSADLVCPSGGVPLNIPFLVEARQRDIPFSNDSQIFLESAPCKVIGITGSAGKTTTTTLVGRVAKAAGKRVWVGGNIGNPLIAQLEQMSVEDLAVMELSSFQLELMTCSPEVAAILNITPNHLDRHGTMEAYTAAKAHIIAYQGDRDDAILGRDDPVAWGIAPHIIGSRWSFGCEPLPAGELGTWMEGEQLWLRHSLGESVVLDREMIGLRGMHNLANVLATCAIAGAAGLPIQAMVTGVQGFSGVPHRLEFVRSWRGADWYNDSIATAPERAIAAMQSFSEPLILLAGGRDKNLPWETFARLVNEKVKHLIVFGEAANLIEMAARKVKTRSYDIHRCGKLHEAVQTAANLVQAGDIVLLAPGGTSFDEFRDFEERGERFREWVNRLS
jgi:UDP-N-acetylmuramoylalanine--D-glutamate ligase